MTKIKANKKKYPYHNSFRCEKDSQAQMEFILAQTGMSKSEFMRQAIQFYFEYEFKKNNK